MIHMAWFRDLKMTNFYYVDNDQLVWRWCALQCCERAWKQQSWLGRGLIHAHLIVGENEQVDDTSLSRRPNQWLTHVCCRLICVVRIGIVSELHMPTRIEGLTASGVFLLPLSARLSVMSACITPSQQVQFLLREPDCIWDTILHCAFLD